MIPFAVANAPADTKFLACVTGDKIVLVITLSKHRKDSISACHFLIDWLKTKGPFWKFEKTKNAGHWVKALESDNLEEKKWDN